MHILCTVQIVDARKAFVFEAGNIKRVKADFLGEYFPDKKKLFQSQTILVLRNDKQFDHFQRSVSQLNGKGVSFMTGLQKIRRETLDNFDDEFYYLKANWFQVNDQLAFFYQEEVSDFMTNSMIFK